MQEQAAQLEEMVSTFKLDTNTTQRLGGGNRPALRRPALALGQ
jgi:methyl-accepting chemotaxis protein-1 (serine sensor receptor)